MIKTVIKDKKLQIDGIPDSHKIEYVMIDKETRERLYVVHKSEVELGYNSFGLHIGPQNELREAQIKNVERYRDGGTTIIDYTLANSEGRLYFASPLHDGRKHTDSYNGKTIELEKLL